MTTRTARPAIPRNALRIAVGAVLVLAGLAKVFAPVATARVIEARGIPDAMVVGIVASILETCAGTAILLGWFVRKTAFAALLFYVPIAVVFHYRFDRPLDVAFDLIVIVALWILATREQFSRP